MNTQTSLPIAKPQRNFVTLHQDLVSWKDIKPYFDQLLEEKIQDEGQFERWAKKISELDSIVEESGTRLYIDMTCYTNNEEYAQAYSKFVEEVVPNLTEAQNELQKKIAEFPFLNSSKLEYYQIWFQSIRNELSLFRQENIPLDTQVSLKIQEYQQLTSCLTAEYEGKEQTFAQLSVKLNEPDRKVRETVWKLINKKRLEHKDKLNELFSEMFERRNQISTNIGCKDYLEYIFKAKERFDYTPESCKTFHKSIENHIVPIYKQLLKARQEKLKLPSLKPWDLNCDPNSLPPLKPFTKIEELIDKTSEVFGRIDSDFHAYFNFMKDNSLLDLENRLGKAPGGYQCALDEQRTPFIFMNATGTNSDIFTLFHESGHAFHQFLMKDISLSAYRNIQSEIAEVASMSMELIAAEHLDVFYSPEEVKRARIDQYEDIFKLLPWVAVVDAFQIWMYSYPGHTTREREEKFSELIDRFSPSMDYSGLEQIKENGWHRQLHIFEVPFYYIEYGIAQLGALQIYKNYKTNPTKALDMYKSGFALGSSKPLPELFEAVGAQFDFSDRTIQPLSQFVLSELEKL